MCRTVSDSQRGSTFSAHPTGVFRPLSRLLAGTTGSVLREARKRGLESEKYRIATCQKRAKICANRSALSQTHCVMYTGLLCNYVYLSSSIRIFISPLKRKPMCEYISIAPFLPLQKENFSINQGAQGSERNNMNTTPRTATRQFRKKNNEQEAFLNHRPPSEFQMHVKPVDLYPTIYIYPRSSLVSSAAI